MRCEIADYVPAPRVAPTAAWTAFGFGLLYAGVSVYWAAGGRWLLDTVGGSLGQLGRQRDTAALMTVWAAAVIKLIAAVIPLLAIRRSRGSRRRVVRILAWAEAAILVGYGHVLTAAGLLLQAGIILPAAGADHGALAWHAFLWDPWFLVWGLLVLLAMTNANQEKRFPCVRSAS